MEGKPLQVASDVVAVATRTLLAAGYAISGVHRQPGHIEFKCERVSRLGPTVQFLIAITDQGEFPEDHVKDIAHAAVNQNRLAVLVSNSGGPHQLGWTEFLEIMGGAVPSWKALTDEYREHLQKASKNEMPSGLTGEAWWIFESLVADGLEFCFGRRVNRLGGQRRGKRVSDMVAPLPDFSVVVVDAKASGSGFDANAGSLRALAEYVNKQKQRQQGGGDVVAALVVSSAFVQDERGLAVAAKEFLGQTRIPLCFLTASDLWLIVRTLRDKPDIRSCIRWSMLLAGGLIQAPQIESEIRAVTQERCETREL
jgi:hypothetical protein